MRCHELEFGRQKGQVTGEPGHFGLAGANSEVNKEGKGLSWLGIIVVVVVGLAPRARPKYNHFLPLFPPFARPMRSSRGQKLAQKAKAAGNAPPPTLQAASAARSSTPPVPDFTYAPGEAGRIARRYVEQVCAAAGSRRQPIHVSDSSSNPSDPREALRWTGRPSIRSS